jgi:hypothetical protein
MGKSSKLVSKAKKAGVKAMKKRGEFFGTPKTTDVTDAIKAAISEVGKPTATTDVVATPKAKGAKVTGIAGFSTEVPEAPKAEVKLTTAPVELSEADKAALAARKAKAAKSAKAHGSPVGEVKSDEAAVETPKAPETTPTPVVSEAEKAEVLAEAPAKVKKVPTVKTGEGRDSLGSLVGSGASKVNAVMLAAKEPLTVKQVTDLAGGFANTRNHLVKLLVMGSVKHSDGKWSLIAAKAPTTETPKKKGKKAAK